MLFVEKDNYGSSTIANLPSKAPKIRNDATFEKDYLSGKYGGIPKINTQLNLYENQSGEASDA